MAHDGTVVIKITADDEEFKKSLSALGKTGNTVLKTLAKGAAAAGAALAGIGAYAVKVGSDFEAGMSKVEAISGATAAEMEQLTAKAKEMGQTTKFSATESAEALQYMAMAGWKTEQMTAGLPGIMNLAAASGESLASVSDIVTDALTAFGMQAEESAHFADVLAKASSNSNTNVAMMGETFKYAAPVAGSLGYSVEDTAVAIGLMANSGIKAEMAGTALRGMLTNLAKPTRLTKKYIEDLGLSLTDSQGKMKPLSALVGELREKFAGLTEAQKAEYAAGVAGKEGMSGLLAIVNASAEDYEKLTREINNASGAAAAQAKIMMDNLPGALTLLGSNLEGVGIQIYESLETPLKQAVQSANDGVSALAKSLSGGTLKTSMDKLGKALGEMVKTVASLATKAIPKLINAFAFVVDHGKQIVVMLVAAKAAMLAFKAVMVMEKAAAAWKVAATAVTAYTTAQASATVSLTVGQAAVGVLTGKIGLAAAAQAAWNAVTAAHPFILAAAAIASLVAGIGILIATQKDAKSETQQFAEEQEKLKEKLDAQRLAREELQNTTAENIKAADAEIDAVKGYIQELDHYTDAQGRVNDEHRTRADWLMQEINELIPGAVEKLEDEAGAHYKIIDSIDEEIAAKRKAALLDAMQPAYEENLNKRIDAQNNLTQALRNQETAANKLRDTEEKLKDLRAHLSEFTASAGYLNTSITIGGESYTMEKLQDAIAGAEKELGTWKTQVEQSTGAVNLAQTEVEKLNEFFQIYDTTTAAQAMEDLDKVSGQFHAHQKEYSAQDAALLQESLVLTRETYARRKQEFEAHAEEMTEAERQRAQSELAELKANLDAIANALHDGSATALDVWRASIEASAPDVSAAMQLVADGVLSAADVSGEMRAIGGNLAQGVAAGIRENASVAIDAAINMSRSVANASKKASKIQSPSRVFRDEVGKMMALGVAAGIDAGAPEALASITRLSEAARRHAANEAKSYQDAGAKYVENLTYGVERMADKSMAAIEQWVQADVDAYLAKTDAETDALVSAKKAQMETVSEVQKEALQKEIDQIKADAAERKRRYQEAGREATAAYQAALEDGYQSALATVKERVGAITDEFQKAHDDIIRQQQDMESKLSGFGALFTIDQKTGKLSLENIEDNIDAIARYDAALTALQEKGASDAFMKEAASLGVEEGTKFAEALAALGDAEFEAYTGAWEEQRTLAASVAAKFYADQLETLETDFKDKLDETLNDIPALMQNIGQDSVQGMIDGLYSKSGMLSQAARDIVSQAVGAMRREADIHSPSKKTRDLIGKPMAEGVSVGFEEKLAGVHRQVQRVLGNEMARMSAGAQMQAGRQVALQNSRSEIRTYHEKTTVTQTPVIEFRGNLAGLGRVLEPVIRLEQRRKGTSFKGGQT